MTWTFVPVLLPLATLVTGGGDAAVSGGAVGGGGAAGVGLAVGAVAEVGVFFFVVAMGHLSFLSRWGLRVPVWG